MRDWFTATEWYIILGLLILATILFVTSYFWPHKGGKHSAEANTGSIEIKLYTSDLQRGTQHWHDFPNAPRPMWADPAPRLEELEVDVTDLSLLRLTPANEVQGATEEWSPLAAIDAQTDFIDERLTAAYDELDLVPVKPRIHDHFALRQMLEDAWWEQAFAILDDELEQQLRRCDAAVDAILPGGLRRLTLAAA